MLYEPSLLLLHFWLGFTMIVTLIASKRLKKTSSGMFRDYLLLGVNLDYESFSYTRFNSCLRKFGDKQINIENLSSGLGSAKKSKLRQYVWETS